MDSLETCRSVTSYFMKKRLQVMLWHHDARVNSHQRWKQTRFRVCFHLWCELTSTMNVKEWQVSWISREAVEREIGQWCLISEVCWAQWSDLAGLQWWTLAFAWSIVCESHAAGLLSNTACHEIHETCHSITFYFMSELIYWYPQEVHSAKYLPP